MFNNMKLELKHFNFLSLFSISLFIVEYFFTHSPFGCTIFPHQLKDIFPPALDLSLPNQSGSSKLCEGGGAFQKKSFGRLSQLQTVREKAKRGPRGKFPLSIRLLPLQHHSVTEGSNHRTSLSSQHFYSPSLADLCSSLLQPIGSYLKSPKLFGVFSTAL